MTPCLRLAALLLVVLSGAGCGSMAQNIVLRRNPATRMLPRFDRCPNDGEPVRLLIDRRCPGSVCGYSCLPDRWDATTTRPQ